MRTVPPGSGAAEPEVGDFPWPSVLATAAVLAVCVGFPLTVSYAAPELRDSLSVSRGQLGLAVGVFYGATGVASVAAGVAADRLGARRATAMSMLLVLLGLVISSVRASFTALVVTSVVAGVGYALGNAGTSMALADGLTPAQRDLGFTIRTAGVPVMLVLSRPASLLWPRPSAGVRCSAASWRSRSSRDCSPCACWGQDGQLPGRSRQGALPQVGCPLASGGSRSRRCCSSLARAR